MKVYRFLILLFFVGLISCSNDDDSPSLCDQGTIISADRYANDLSDFLTVSSVELQGDCLLITYSASGCDGDSWVVNLIDSEVVTFSLPPQRNLRLTLDNNEACLAVFSKELSFDVSDLKVEGNQVLLNIVNSDHQVSYVY